MHWHASASKTARGLGDALAHSHLSLTLADMRMADAPLIGVNDPFCAMTGYSAAQSLGRNCRFLQPTGGAGPVRARMRDFLRDAAVDQARFVVPNVSRSGTRFLNLVYMTKLRKGEELAYVLGSQFDMTSSSGAAADLYDTALRTDVKSLGKLAGEYGLVVLGTYDSLATSHAIIAKARLDRPGSDR